MAVIYILLTTKLKLKSKQCLVYKPILLLAIKLRINKKFEIMPKFLLKEILFLISLSSIIRTKQAQN